MGRGGGGRKKFHFDPLLGYFNELGRLVKGGPAGLGWAGWFRVGRLIKGEPASYYSPKGVFSSLLALHSPCRLTYVSTHRVRISRAGQSIELRAALPRRYG